MKLPENEKRLDDGTVVRKVLSGEGDSFRILVERYGGLCQYFFRQRRNCDWETARDLTQEAFLRAFQNLGKLRSGSSFKAWMLSICRNLAYDNVQKEKSTPRSHGAPDPAGPHPAGLEKSIVERITLGDAVRILPDRHREIVEMKYFAGLSCAEIAQIMELPEGTIKSDLFHARARLLEILEDEEEKID